MHFIIGMLNLHMNVYDDHEHVALTRLHWYLKKTGNMMVVQHVSGLSLLNRHVSDFESNFYIIRYQTWSTLYVHVTQ